MISPSSDHLHSGLPCSCSCPSPSSTPPNSYCPTSPPLQPSASIFPAPLPIYTESPRGDMTPTPTSEIKQRPCIQWVQKPPPPCSLLWASVTSYPVPCCQPSLLSIMAYRSTLYYS